MALQSSGQITINDIHVEAGGGSGSEAKINDADIRGLIDKSSGAQNAFNEYYGASSELVLTSGGTINGQNQRQEITASTYISSGGTLRIPSNMWVWSDSRTTAALTIDIPCTIINEGKIIGKGGQGGSGLRIKNQPHPTTSTYNSGYSTATLGSGSDGGPAIKINSGVSGVTITNSSGAYIAGGGGGGGSSHVEPSNTGAGGGAGAGGAEGGFNHGPNWEDANKGTGWPYRTTNGAQYSDFGIYGTNNGNPPLIGYGGRLNEKSWYVTTSLHASGNYYTWTKNFEADAGGAGVTSSGEDQTSGGGWGSGRILPGARHIRTNRPYGGAGGEAGQNGGSGGYSGQSGGGGGWGSAGGKGYRGTFTSAQCQGGDAGKAVDDSGVSYTLSNSGTIYGGT